MVAPCRNRRAVGKRWNIECTQVLMTSHWSAKLRPRASTSLSGGPAGFAFVSLCRFGTAGLDEVNGVDDGDTAA